MQESQGKVMNRSFVILGAVLIQLCLGAIYAWSVFTPYLKKVCFTEQEYKIFLEKTPKAKELETLTVFTDKQYEAFLQEYSQAKEVLQSLVENEDDKIYIDLNKISVRQLEKETLTAIVKRKIVEKKGGRIYIAAYNIPDSRNKKLGENAFDKCYFNFSTTQTTTIFSVGLAIFAVVMVLAGKWQAKAGPRIVALTGGAVLGAGYILAGLFGKTFIPQLIFIGIIGGTGIGLAYVCPIAVGMKWFPDKKGLITGLAVAGFGFGAIIWIKLAGSWGGLLESMGVLKVFLIYGIAFAASVIIGSIWMVNPPEGWKPAGWAPPESTDNGSTSSESSADLLPGRMLKTPQFYGLWVMFIFSGMAGLMTIGIIKLFGIDALQNSGIDAVRASAIAGTAMAVFYSIANGLGRIAWGTLSEKIGRKMSLTLMCALQGVMMLLFYWMGGNQYLLYLGAAIIGFNFGGNFALFPLATADFFGTKNVGQNYGWVFTAYGVGGIIGPIMAGMIRDAGSWLPAFIICGVACLVAAVISLILKRPKQTASVA